MEDFLRLTINQWRTRCPLQLAVETLGWGSTPPQLQRHTGRMSIIDKQRIAAVRTLEAMGYVFRDEWIAPAGLTCRQRLKRMPCTSCLCCAPISWRAAPRIPRRPESLR